MIHFFQMSFCKMRLLSLFLLSATGLFAQQEIGLHFMHNLWQANKTNPAIVPENNLVIGLPGIRNNLFFTGPTYDDIVFKNEAGKSIIDIDRAIGVLDPQNLIRDDLELTTFSFALKIHGLTFSFSHAIKFSVFLQYPKTLPQVIWQGNAQFIGETVSLSNDLELNGYNEYAFGAAYKFGKLTLGAKAKFLNGIGNVSTDRAHRRASLFTDPDIFQLTLDADYRLNSSGALNYESFRDFNLDFNYDPASTQNLFSQNKGFAIDLGLRLEIGKFDISVSVLDLGSIDWKADVRNYIADGIFKYDGLDFSQALTDQSVNFDQALDTLEQIFQVTEINTAYSTDLPTKVYVSATYQLNKSWEIGGLFFTESYRGKTFPAVALSANVDLLPKIISLGATYAILHDDSFDNIGLNAVVKLGPVQFFGTTDNIISAFQPGQKQNFSVRLGLNLVFFQPKTYSAENP